MSFNFGISRCLPTSYFKGASLQVRRTCGRYFMYEECSTLYPKAHLSVCSFVSPRRTYCWSSLSWKPGEERFKIMDEIPDHFDLIYKTPTYLYFKWGYFIACAITASVFGIILYSFEYEKSEITLGENEFSQMSNEVLCYIAALTAFFFAIQICITRMPVRIYNSSMKKKYIFIFNGKIPLTSIKKTCFKGEVLKYEPIDIISECLPWNKCSYLLSKSTKIYIFEDLFRKPSDFHDMFDRQDHDTD